MDISFLTLLLTVAIGAAVFGLIFTQSQSTRKVDRSEELAELQKTVRLLIERGVGTAGPPTAPLSDKAPQPAAAESKSNGTSTFTFGPQPAKHSAPLSPRSSPAIPSSPPSLSLGPAPLSPSHQGKGGSPADVYQEVFQLQESIKQLERRNRELNRQLTLTEVSNVVDVERKYGLKAPGQPSDLKLTPSEVETIRAIFNLFDVEQRGTISTAEIESLHAKLGEPLSQEEAQAATKELDQDGTGQVNFHQFLYWWFESHRGGKKSTRYTERFKLVSAKLSPEVFNVDRVITQDSGNPYTLEYRLFFYLKQPNAALRQISPWHDVPLYRVGLGADGQIYNMVCEIPRYTRAKFECSTGEPYNPIKGQSTPRTRSLLSSPVSHHPLTLSFLCAVSQSAASQSHGSAPLPAVPPLSPRASLPSPLCCVSVPPPLLQQDTQHGKLRYYKHGDIMFNYGFLPQTWEDPSYVRRALSPSPLPSPCPPLLVPHPFSAISLRCPMPLRCRTTPVCRATTTPSTCWTSVQSSCARARSWR